MGTRRPRRRDAPARPASLFRGQGACQAIEDAVVLAHTSDLADYTAARLPRTTDMVSRSRRVARAVAVQARPAVLLRDFALALAGRLPLTRMAAAMYDWSPPSADNGHVHCGDWRN